MRESSYKNAIQYLYGLQKYGIKFGLSKTSNIMKLLGNPHVGQKYIHIAGSNGKGSVAAMVESILIKSGKKVGFYSSPHLVRFTERFRINREEISEEDAAVYIERLRGLFHPDHPPTFFEATTAMALDYFAGEKTDIAIMEVGMGGRLDATNIIMPLVSVITNISLEHQYFLGSRLKDIAGEKAGIIKSGVELVTAATQPAVLSVFERICAEKGSPFLRVGREFRYRATKSGFSYHGIKRTFRNLKAGLLGSYQKRNVALALAVTELLENKGFDIYSDNIIEGIRDTIWPGRMHLVSSSPKTILDGAHNPDAIRMLASSIGRDVPHDRLILVLGIMEDKDIPKIIKEIIPVAHYTVCTRPDYYRSAKPELLMKEVTANGGHGELIPSLSDAIARAREIARPEDLVLITGSLFTVGEALTYFDPEKYRPD